MTGSCDPPEDWWETVPGAAIALVLSAALAFTALGMAWTDEDGGAWLAAGIAMILVGLTGANLTHATQRRTDRLARMARPPTRPYDWGREPRDIEPAPTVTVYSHDPDGNVDGWRVEHPTGIDHRFIDGQCSCGVMDLGTYHPEDRRD